MKYVGDRAFCASWLVQATPPPGGGDRGSLGAWRRRAYASRGAALAICAVNTWIRPDVPDEEDWRPAE